MDKKDFTANEAIRILSIIAQINAEIFELLGFCSSRDGYEEAGLGSTLLADVMSEPLLHPDISIKADSARTIKILHDVLHRAHSLTDYDIYEKAEELIDRVYELEAEQKNKHWKE